MPAHCPPVPHLHPQSPATGQDSPAQGLSVSPRACVPGRFSPARCEQWLGLLAVSVTCCVFVTQPLMVSSSLSRSHHGAQEGAGGSVWGPVAAVLGLTRETGGRAKLRGTSVSRSPGRPWFLRDLRVATQGASGLGPEGKCPCVRAGPRGSDGEQGQLHRAQMGVVTAGACVSFQSGLVALGFAWKRRSDANFFTESLREATEGLDANLEGLSRSHTPHAPSSSDPGGAGTVERVRRVWGLRPSLSSRSHAMAFVGVGITLGTQARLHFCRPGGCVSFLSSFAHT